ncbi:hypothetical protein [Microbulbifer marinus]|uniref:Sel1 repeat-containing protein n=1 Tax=Microbulbifer marinus TaxID=658218 RepID=A0A1H3YIV8_9GAMM|nr:hypothetical protein [Microbulbifer marinus]SEA11490.1 hypothetical protein SAMN05216562_1796 [Microbulbifer marinus]
MNKILFLTIALFTYISAHADTDASTNQELLELFNEDQQVRKSKNVDWDIIARQDAERRRSVLAMVAAGQLHTSEDYYHAAMIFQHGESADDIRTAFSFAWMAITLDPSNDSARWLSAAAWDRIMMREDMPQWYGTQFSRPSPEDPWELYKIDESAVTDEERARMKVRSLEDSRALVEKLNQ